MSVGYIFLIVALSLNAGANILMKLGSSQLETANQALGADATLFDKLWLYATNPFLVIGIIMFGLNVLFYIEALKKLDLSIAYPIMMSGGVLIITLFSLFYLKEKLVLMQLLGISLIACGIILLTSYAKM
ncbi:MAG: hypothetical protein KDK39_06650 [Leptospiraceae bacterium]|nr:hypothetical protein [Leptospiraceae bacterium]